MPLIRIVGILSIALSLHAFQLRLGGGALCANKRSLRMEYIPDGLTKAQWEAIKKREAEEKKAGGNLAALGTGKFKSRSFEAWHKAGGKHLFAVNPKEVVYEERPYMQRKNGDWEGSDLSSRGLQGKGQGGASKRLELDDIYEKAKKEGKLDSASIFGGMPLPWTSEAANKLSNMGREPGMNDPKKAPGAVAAKKLTPEEMNRLKANLFKPIKTELKQPPQAPQAAPAGEEGSKGTKKRFGLF